MNGTFFFMAFLGDIFGGILKSGAVEKAASTAGKDIIKDVPTKTHIPQVPPREDSIGSSGDTPSSGLLQGLGHAFKAHNRTAFSAVRGSLRDPGAPEMHVAGRDGIEDAVKDHKNLPTLAINGVNNRLSHDGIDLSPTSAEKLKHIINKHEGSEGFDGFAKARSDEADHFGGRALHYLNDAQTTGTVNSWRKAGEHAAGATMNTLGSATSRFTNNYMRTMNDTHGFFEDHAGTYGGIGKVKE